ncbi:hypothetical protein OG739_14170 [Streptomyces longwoodensis]|uniref:hypothetical protein n=1 Tax=Streptomyces longwoodensis TaxID=68231 RepID=UPI002DD7D168|nr:hypothetical protein [Streptomyces longwoodensis]WRY88740.1 hypothetical protein OG481_09440 [Streptomyces longwoodensis]WTI46968.1 hypothetical protein OG547_21895 [Streptomyces longwoodensis]WUC59717.1 hypothetical protein OHA09_22845 [Streptomyces longwoodensis]
MGSGTRGVIRRLAAGVAVLTASGVLALAAPGSAQAAAVHACAGRKVRTLSFTTGSVQVFRQGRYVCAVTYAKNPRGTKPMSVSVQARGGRPWRIQARTTRQVGPVTVYAGHRCVWVKGSVGPKAVSSGWILC